MGGAGARAVLLVAILALPAVTALGCGGGSESTVTVRERVVTETAAGSTERNSGPRLGDGCTAESTIGAEVEVQTVRGPLRCEEAERVMEIYFGNAASSGVGSGGALQVAGWHCISAPPPEEPLAGHCEERTGEEREFAIYNIGWAFRPENHDADCHLAPPEGAGQSNLRATDIDCGAAEIVLGSWQSHCAGTQGACAVGYGVSCRSEQLGYELAVVKCRGRGDQWVSFETGA